VVLVRRACPRTVARVATVSGPAPTDGGAGGG